MIELHSPLFEVVVASLGWTLLHFLWQGAVVGVLFGVSLALASRAGARTRYHIGLFYLALLAALPVMTFMWLMPGAREAAATTTVAEPITVAALSVAAATAADWRAFVDPYLPWTVLGWSFGVMLMTARLLLEWRDVRRLTRLDVEPLSAEWRARVARLRERLDVHRAVMVLRSARVAVPIVVGWLRPVILVPVSAFTGLTPWQLELILMHELAHVRRHDYVVNLLQVVVETLLFYHPVVRWVSRVVREEREHCCDDLVVARSGDAISYARALAELAGAQSMGLQTSVGSDGGKLLLRIKRLVTDHEPRRVSTHWSVGAMLAVFGMSVSGLLQPGAQRAEEPEAMAGIETTVRTAAMPAVDPAPLEALREFVQSTAPVPAPASEPPVAPSSAAQAGSGGVSAPIERANPQPAHEGNAVSGSATQAAVPEPAALGGSGPEIADAAAGTHDATTTAITTPAVSAPPATASPAPASADTAASGSAASPSEPAARANKSRPTRPISGKAPEFPDDARLDGIEGWVKFNYTIGTNGEVRNVRIVDAQPRNVFESAVRRAVRSWRFAPILVNGAPVEREMTQTIEFSLGRAASDEEICTATGTRIC